MGTGIILLHILEKDTVISSPILFKGPQYYVEHLSLCTILA